MLGSNPPGQLRVVSPSWTGHRLHHPSPGGGTIQLVVIAFLQPLQYIVSRRRDSDLEWSSLIASRVPGDSLNTSPICFQFALTSMIADSMSSKSCSPVNGTGLDVSCRCVYSSWQLPNSYGECVTLDATCVHVHHIPSGESSTPDTSISVEGNQTYSVHNYRPPSQVSTQGQSSLSCTACETDVSHTHCTSFSFYSTHCVIACQLPTSVGNYILQPCQNRSGVYTVTTFHLCTTLCWIFNTHPKPWQWTVGTPRWQFG